MKKKCWLFLVAVILAVTPVFSQKDYKQLYEHKIHSFNRMKHTGWTLTGIGSGFAFAGSALLITLPSNDRDSHDSDFAGDGLEDFVQAMGGIICLGVGVGLMAGGITLGSIGSHKVKSYNNKLNNLSLGVICTPRKQGLMLTYRF
jgi:hypothetical protein